ncbi:hypothetical protein [Streptomyces sp. NPDC050485]|uniref:hypothetical protein n=1 Tax=Streptomyces sp. NPDC050485 TaxID=3365617 RepID=UPI0037B2950C
MARAYLFWRTGFGHYGTAVPARRANARHCLGWAKGWTSTEMAELLSQSPVAIPGAVYTHPTALRDRGLLRLDDAAVELDGPCPPPTGTAAARN